MIDASNGNTRPDERKLGSGSLFSCLAIGAGIGAAYYVLKNSFDLSPPISVIAIVGGVIVSVVVPIYLRSRAVYWKLALLLALSSVALAAYLTWANT